MAEIRAATAANVFRVAAAPGDTVDAGATLVVLEAAKMEIPVRTEDPGSVVGVEVDEGDTVREGDVLVVLE
jgi:acetyl-CoA carboxylase biotin carboxyl carrier protein